MKIKKVPTMSLIKWKKNKTKEKKSIKYSGIRKERWLLKDLNVLDQAMQWLTCSTRKKDTWRKIAWNTSNGLKINVIIPLLCVMNLTL